MKHFMLPRSPYANPSPNPNPLSELSASPNPNPNPKQKHPTPRKQKCPPKDKENSDPGFTFDTTVAGKPSPAGKIRSPLPPRPPLKRKLSNDTVFDISGFGPSSSSSSDSGVKVVVRMRPLNKDEEDGEMIVQKMSNDSLSINGQTFTFDSVADMDSTQLDIFQLVGAPLVENCLAGFNSSVFAYGQTGSGKTYTMWGPANALLEENLANDQQGLTPRVFERLFARINEEQTKHADKQLKYRCRCSFLEIYNEQITDLLDPSQKNLQIREDVKSGVYVENLTEECVSSMRDVIQLLLKGLSNRRTGATSINAESSRSHSVFTCVVESQCKSVSDGLSSFKTSRINLVDLAGSERQKLTGAGGERLKEAGNINRSLSQLGNLINILAETSQTGKQRHIPYRDSRLTFLLQESLGGNAKLAMICAVSPAQRCKSETFSTLRFAQRAKAIKNKAVVNEVMQDDVNFLREVIKQLKDELVRMKAHGNQTDPNAAYANSWNARRSLNLLKFSLKHPMALRHVDADGDEEMEIDEEAVEKLCIQVGLHSTSTESRGCMDTKVEDHAHHSGSHLLDSKEGNCQDPRVNTSGIKCIEKQASGLSDVSMEDGMSEIDNTNNNDNNEVAMDEGNNPSVESSDTANIEEKIVNEAPCKPTKDGSALVLSESANIVDTEAAKSSPNGSLDPVAQNLSIVPSDVSPTLQSPTPSLSPTLVSSSRKSLRTSQMLTASQKDVQSCRLGKEDAHSSTRKSISQLVTTAISDNIRRSTTEHLAASLHRGLEIIDSHRQSSAFRRSTFRYSYKPADLKPILAIEKVDVGIQTLPESTEMMEEDDTSYICSNCKNRTHGDLKDVNDTSNLQLVPVDRSLSAEKPKKQVPKAVEKVLAGAIRREMALEDFCGKQTSEIAQLNRLVQQYKHERECNAIIGQMREDKIIRLENLMDGVLPSEDFMEEEFLSLRKEHELLKEKYENHPEVLRTKIELKRVQDELERLRSFFDMGERDVLLEEIHDLRSQLQYYTDNSPRTARLQRKSLLQLTYSCEPSPPAMNTIPESTEENSVPESTEVNNIPESTEVNSVPESTEENSAEKLEKERKQWTEVESQWISLAEELKMELESSRSNSEQLRQELETEKKCSKELKEAMQLAMEGHARMLEQYADLEERHMEMLARHRKMQEGIQDVKKAAARAGVKGAESRFINALAAEISALKVEREKERRYLRDENKMLQSQLRDTAEAVQAAGELLVRLKEAEEAVVAAEKRAAEAEEETEKSRKEIEKLKKKHDHEARYDAGECHSTGDDRWKQEFESFYNNGVDDELSSKFTEPSSWFSGYDRCNI